MNRDLLWGPPSYPVGKFWSMKLSAHFPSWRRYYVSRDRGATFHEMNVLEYLSYGQSRPHNGDCGNWIMADYVAGLLKKYHE
jgi:hypothetical protein